MKSLTLYALVISTTFVAAAVQPAEEPAEMHVAMALAGPGMDTSCHSAACDQGWQAARDNFVHDAADCSQLSQVQGEVAGCRAFVNETLQERLENQW